MVKGVGLDPKLLGLVGKVTHWLAQMTWQFERGMQG